MLTPKDIEGQFICSDVILRQVRPDAVITAATLGVKLREPVWALWGSMRPLGTPSTTIPVTLLAARGEVVTGPRTKANPGLVEVRYKQEKGKTFWHPLRDILPMEQLPPGCREFHPDVIIESEQAEETGTSGSDTSYAAESDEEAACRKRTAQGTPGSGHKAKKKAKPAAKKAKKAPGRCVEREEILRMAAQIEETRNVPMDVLKTYSKASLHALLEQFELYFPQSAKHDMLVLRLKQAVEAGKNRPRLVPPEMPAGAYGYSRLSLLRHTGNPLNPPPAHTNTSPPPPPPTLALGLTPHTSTSSPSTRHHSCAEAYDCSQRYMNTLVVLSHHGAAASSSRPGLRAHPAPPPGFP